MKLTLEDMTKEELIRYIRQDYFHQPTHRVLLGLRWESLAGEAQRIREQAIQEGKGWEGIKTAEAYEHWRDAQLLFDKGMALDNKADAVFKELSEANRS